MIHFENKYFQKEKISNEQIKQFISSISRDLKIAEESNVPDVTFKFSYDALIKIGILLVADKGYRIRSQSGHHVKLLEKLSQILQDEDALIIGNKMRKERNIGLYAGGYSASEKESQEYLSFVKNIFIKTKKTLKSSC